MPADEGGRGETGRRGDGATRRRGDAGTRRRARGRRVEHPRPRVSSRPSPPPSPPSPPSPRLRVSASPRLPVSFLRAWYPVALIPFTYKELEYLIPRIHPRDFDWELAAIDRWIFGVDPTVWLERATWPLLTELFQLSYITYYVLPLALGVVVWRKGWFDKFHFLVFVIVLSFYISYLGYIAVPAIGPRFILAGDQSFPLKGLLLVDWIRATLDRAEGITRDCFPSGHVMLTLVVVYYARKFHRPTFWWALPAASALIISTVYLRYHYVVDVIAGVVLAVAVVASADLLYKTLGGNMRSSNEGA